MSQVAYFPQLGDGTYSGIPLVKRRYFRTLVNLLEGGHVIKYRDEGARYVEWELYYQGLSDSELATLLSFYEEMSGRCGEFVFLDPFGNLFANSEDLSKPEWTKDPGLVVAASLWEVSPLALTKHTLSNFAIVGQKLRQVISSPGWFVYCFSFLARAMVGSLEVTVFSWSGSMRQETRVPLDARWRQVVLPVRLNSMEESIGFGVEIPANSVMEIAGLQVQAQIGPSRYVPSYGPGAIYRHCRFADDLLRWRTEGPDSHRCQFRIISYLPEQI